MKTKKEELDEDWSRKWSRTDLERLEHENGIRPDLMC